MEPMIVDYAELTYLLDQAGVDSPMGVAREQFPLPVDSVARQKTLVAGQAQLEARDDASQLSRLVTALANPAQVIQTQRSDVDGPLQFLWHFVDESTIVSVSLPEEGKYELASVTDRDAAFDQIEALLPLESSPDTYRLTIDREDFITVRDLAASWAEVPALEILEADGLDNIGAEALFDCAADPQWRGVIDFMHSRGDTVANQVSLRVAQGQEISLMGRPYAVEEDVLLIETVQPGAFRSALEDAWFNLAD